MPSTNLITSAYHKALLAARNRGHALGRRALQKFNRQLRDALKDLELKSDNPITRARALDLKRQIVGLLAQFEKVAVNETTGAVRLTVLDTAKLHSSVVERLLKTFRPDDAETLNQFNRLNVRAIQALGAREKNAANFRTLMRRNLEDAAPDLDRVLVSGVARGISVAKLTKDVAKVLGGDFPDLQDYGMRKSDLSGMRTVLSDSRRIARSEINNAMREANRMALEQSPIVLAVQFQLSGAHDVEDECDEIASRDSGYGPGFYLPEDFPLAPHPNCGCYPGQVLFKPVEEWAA